MEKNKRKRQLTPKQERYCQEYALVGVQSTAYKNSYNAENMSDEAISVEASRLMDNPRISLRISEIKAQQSKRYEAKKDIAIKELCDIIGFKVKDLFYIDPKTGKSKSRLPTELPEHVEGVIQELINDRGKVKYKMYNKIDAIKQLSSLLGWDTPTQVNVNGPDGNNTISIGFNKDE